MSRWIDQFKNHSFRGVWDNIVTLSASLTVSDETIITDLQELARLRKVVEFINELLESCDPELIPLTTWNSFNDQASNCYNQLQNYSQNKNIGHLTEANSHLDNLLTYIRPYMIPAKSAAQAAGKAFKAYSDTVEEHIQILKDSVKNATSNVNESQKKADEYIAAIKISSERIGGLEQKFFVGDGDVKALEERANNLLIEFEGWSKKIGEYHKKLTAGNEQESSIILQVDNAHKEALKNSKSITELFAAIKEETDKLQDFYINIFGESDEAGETKGGLKNELILRRKELDTFKDDQKKTYDTLLGEIESLLPGATSAGLAAAYKELKETFDSPIRLNTNLFYISLFVLFSTAFISVIDSVGFWSINFIDVSDPIKFLNNFIHKLPIILPVLWLALFSSKRRSEAQRLQQEYAHKEAIAKSYEGLKKQIKDLQSADEDLMKKLLDAAITAISFNASSTLEKKHGDQVPVQEILESLSSKVDDVVTKLNPINLKPQG